MLDTRIGQGHEDLIAVRVHAAMSEWVLGSKKFRNLARCHSHSLKRNTLLYEGSNDAQFHQLEEGECDRAIDRGEIGVYDRRLARPAGSVTRLQPIGVSSNPPTKPLRRKT